MRRATDINYAFHFIGCRVDERDRIRSNRYHGKGFGIRRITKSVNKKLSFVERTKRSRHWIAKSNHAEQLILRRVNYGKRYWKSGPPCKRDRDWRWRSEER